MGLNTLVVSVGLEISGFSWDIDSFSISRESPPTLCAKLASPQTPALQVSGDRSVRSSVTPRAMGVSWLRRLHNPFFQEVPVASFIRLRLYFH